MKYECFRFRLALGLFYLCWNITTQNHVYIWDFDSGGIKISNEGNQ